MPEYRRGSHVLTVCSTSSNDIGQRSKKILLYLLWEELQTELKTFLHTKIIQLQAVHLSEPKYHVFFVLSENSCFQWLE